MMKRLFAPALLPLTLLPLAACGTPQEQCIAKSTRDLRVVESLINQAQGNLARGYAYEEKVIFVPQWQTCEPIDPKTNKPNLCLEDVPETVTRPVAIDLEAEAAKLRGLEAKQKSLTSQAQGAISACKAAYPEKT
jgi:hypothetical protein